MLDEQRKNAILSLLVVAEGSDGYRAVISMAELSPDFAALPIMVGVRENAGAADNALRLIVPGDTKRGRSVSRLASLTVLAVSPDQP